MTRYEYIELLLRQAFGEQPSDDSNITKWLVNTWVNQGIGLAVKQNWKESIEMDGVAYVNNSFYTSFNGLSVSPTNLNFTYQITLPQLPIGVGKNEGVSNLIFIGQNKSDPSYDCIPLSRNQVGYFRQNKQPFNKILYYSEGTYLYAISQIPLDSYTANVSMISGGDSTNLNSTLNVPDDFLPVITAYVMKMLQIERNSPKDLMNDGQDS